MNDGVPTLDFQAIGLSAIREEGFINTFEGAIWSLIGGALFFVFCVWSAAKLKLPGIPEVGAADYVLWGFVGAFFGFLGWVLRLVTRPSLRSIVDRYAPSAGGGMVSAAVGALHGKNSNERLGALRVLRCLGPLAQPAIPSILQEALSTGWKTRGWRKEALQTLGAIGPAAVPAIREVIAKESTKSFMTREMFLVHRAKNILGRLGDRAFARRRVRIQVTVWAVVAMVAFGYVYLIVRASRPDSREDDRRLRRPGTSGEPRDRELVTRTRVLVEGALLYESGRGEFAGDGGAVVIALPGWKHPREPFPVEGIGPADPAPDEMHRTLRVLRRFGGEYARADASGRFSMVVPDLGKYHLLIVSNHATRPAETGIDEVDLIEMDRYFSMANLLIGRYKYSWMLRDVNEHIRIDRRFGLGGEE